MFTDGERPQPAVESAPRHTSRLIAAQCPECRIRNPLPSAPPVAAVINYVLPSAIVKIVACVADLFDSARNA
jgi:hypothetical protein